MAEFFQNTVYRSGDKIDIPTESQVYGKVSYTLPQPPEWLI